MSFLFMIFDLPERQDIDRKARRVALFKNDRFNSWTQDMERYNFALDALAQELKNTLGLLITKSPMSEYEKDALDCWNGKYDQYIVWREGEDVRDIKSERKSEMSSLIVDEPAPETKTTPITLSDGRCYFCNTTDCRHLK